VTPCRHLVTDVDEDGVCGNCGAHLCVNCGHEDSKLTAGWCEPCCRVESALAYATVPDRGTL
jgi:hypothetical protein